MTLNDRIALRAYYAWEAAGRPDGQHEAHWLAAEQVERDLDDADALASLAALSADLQREEAAALAAKRSDAAKRAAATRKANRELAAATVAATAGKPARGRRATAH